MYFPPTTDAPVTFFIAEAASPLPERLINSELMASEKAIALALFAKRAPSVFFAAAAVTTISSNPTDSGFRDMSTFTASPAFTSIPVIVVGKYEM
jgi:hypothetical protein